MSEQKRIAGRFEMHDLIGHGGMGEVYHGVDIQTGDAVAIKVLNQEIIAHTPSLIARFEREGNALRQLAHPHIVKMRAMVLEDGQHYLIMDYVPGGTLRDLLQQRKLLPIRHMLEIALDLADALTRAHRIKIIHRDIKPANVLLAKDGTPRLTDFGVARMEDLDRVTQTGMVVGTYAYLSPETFQGQEPSTTTDIWAFGVLLFEMLTGQTPFQSATSAGLLNQIVNQPPPDLAALRPDTPPPLVALIAQMLAKNPEQRISSMRRVGLELETILQGLDTPLPDTGDRTVIDDMPPSRFATPTPPEEDTTHIMPRIERQRSRWFVGALMTLLVLIVLVVLGITLIGDDDPDDSASRPIADTVIADKYTVLVARIEPVGDVAERDVGRFIAEDLEDVLAPTLFGPKIRIVQYPEIVTSDAEAMAAAESVGAPVIIWGDYTDSFVELRVQAGDTTPYTSLVS